MKRLFFSVIVMMSMTVAFAGNEDNNATNFTKAYMMEVNVNKLGQALNLSRDQYGFMEDAMDVFSADLMCIASAECLEEEPLCYPQYSHQDTVSQVSQTAQRHTQQPWVEQIIQEDNKTV